MQAVNMFIHLLISVSFFCSNTVAKKIQCTVSGHICQSRVRGVDHPCDIPELFIKYPCQNDSSVHNGCDYCPETHGAPMAGPTVQPGILPCRPEDGYIECPNITGQSNCVRRSMRNFAKMPNICRGTSNFDTFPCSDDEVQCKSYRRCIRRYEVNTLFGCNLQSREADIRCHGEDEFECELSGRCIPRSWVLDGSADCSFNTFGIVDRSDEVRPLATCDMDTEFRCSNGRCIPREQVMDGRMQCASGCDEDGPLPSCHVTSEFKCPSNSRCVARYRVNDGYPDCPEGGDENIVITCDEKLEFSCDDRCIPRQWVGDGIRNCASGVDEVTRLVTCREGEFACVDRSRCLPTKYLCDGVKNCDDCSDETDLCDEPRLYRCANATSSCIPWALTCDGFFDCPDDSDEDTNHLSGFKCDIRNRKCFVPQFKLRATAGHFCPDRSDRCFHGDDGGGLLLNCSRCLDNRTLISRRQICDGHIDCPDLSDECPCPSSPVRPLCDAVNLPSSPCGPSLVCDGKEDCPGGLDERFCSWREERVDFVKGDYECGQTNAVLNTSVLFRPIAAFHCNGIFECPFGDDECDDVCGADCDKVLFCPAHGSPDVPIALHKSRVCDGIVNCASGADELNCSGRFYCDGFKRQAATFMQPVVSISSDQRCDLASDCRSEEDEMGCPNQTHFYCHSGTPLFVSRSHYLDGWKDCSDGSDECPFQLHETDSFSSTTELLKLSFFRVFIWIVGSACTILNLMALKLHVGKLMQYTDRNSIQFCNTLFIMQLSIADLLMGVSLLALAIKSVEFSGRYCLHGHEWRTSALCNTIGVLTVISSQTSVNVLVMLTALRLFTTLSPFNARHMLRWFACLGFCLVCWIIAIVTAILPVITAASFNHDVLIEPSPFFPSQVVSREQISYYTQHTNQLYYNSSTMVHSSKWYFITDEAKMHFPYRHLDIKGILGYYSSNAVCLLDLFAVTAPDKFYSLPLVIYNTLALLFISASYVAMYKVTRTSRKTVSGAASRKGKTETSMRRKITAIIVTDALTWTPIIAMVFISYMGVELDGMAYVVSLVVLLPINSMLNPIIYTQVHISVLEFLKMTCCPKPQREITNPSQTAVTHL